MVEFQLIPIFLSSALLSLILLWRLIIFLNPSPAKRKLPPSPPKLPIIGNLHQLGKLPHHNLHSLAQKHGPLMLLHFGSVPALVVSSASAAHEIMKTHDLIFASRPQYKVFKKLLYGCRDVTSAPYGEYWRKMKSILVLQLLSNKRVQSSRFIREEETAILVNKILEYSSSSSETTTTVNLSAMFAELTNDAICRSAFGRKYSDSENGKRFFMLLSDFMQGLGSIGIGEFVPWLSWIGRVTGFDRKMDRVARAMDEIWESVIQERIVETQKGEGFEGKINGDNFLDLLLDIYNGNNDDLSIDRESIKSLIMDAFVGGTETLSTALEWTMAELLRHPTVMEKLQREVRGIVKQKHDITDDDLEKMFYLKAVIKEALRYHPPLPIIAPRVASKDVQINGYDIPAGTVVMINAWAIGRDPINWDEPEKFKPERFLNSSIDFKGLDFEFIPFGSGRRKCPGITFSLVTIEFVLASMVQKFDWKLPNGIDGKDLDMKECPGMTVHRDIPLLAVASPSTTMDHFI